MEATDHELVLNPRGLLLQLAGHAHRAEFDLASAAAVRDANGRLARLFSLLGSGLLAADAPDCVNGVVEVVGELLESDAASNTFEWTIVPRIHLVKCASMFVVRAIDTIDIQNARRAAVLLDHAEGERIPDAAKTLYLARVLEPQIGARLLEAGGGTDVEKDLWIQGALFMVARGYVLKAVDAASPTPSDIVHVRAASEFAAIYSSEAPTHSAMIALALCSAIEVSYRMDGMRVVCAMIDARVELDACVKALQDALVIAHERVIGRAAHCTRMLVAVLPAQQQDEIADTLFDAVLSATVESSEDASALGAAAACALRDLVAALGVHGLLTRANAFADMFASLFVRAARGVFINDKTDVLEAVVMAFEDAVRVGWARLGAHRMCIVQACMTAVLDVRSESQQRRDSVFAASLRVLASLLLCEGRQRTLRLLTELRDKAAQYESVKGARRLFYTALLDANVQERRMSREDGERFGIATGNYFESGVEKLIVSGAHFKN